MIQFVSQLSPSREKACCQRADFDDSLGPHLSLGAN
jgi:hypothetical protein